MVFTQIYTARVHTFLIFALWMLNIPPKNVSSICADPQEVYDIMFDFRGNCSMTVYWTTPDCPIEVARYIVQSAQGCPSRWRSHAALEGNVYSILIEDLALVTSCLLGQCYMRVLAEFNYPDQSERIHSHCVGLGDTFRNYSSPEATTKYYSYVGQQVCLPVRTTCPPNTLPNFFINQQMIALSTGGSEQDDFYLRTNNNILELCISNHSETNSVIHEICHVDTICPLCPEVTGELILMSRTEVQTIIIAPNTTIGPGVGSDPEQEVDCVPSVVRFCLTSYSINIDNTSMEVCICLPLHELHGRGSEDMIIVELSFQINFTVTGNVRLNVSPDDTVNLSPNMTPKCFNVDVPLMDIEYADNSTLEMCMALLGSTNATKCIHVPEPCVEIIVSNNTESEFDGDQTTTQEVDDNTTLGSITTTTSGDIDESNHGLNDGVTAVIILLSIIIAFIGLLVILIILRIFWKKLCCNWKEYKIKSDHEMKPGTTETSQQTPKEINTDGKTTNVQEESDTEI